MAIYNKATTFKQKYWLILLMVVCISYGQTLGMNVWRDANAIFFKFEHLNEPAGYLGTGLLGEGLYKFSVTPYWFIYKIFGYESIWPYYLLNLIFYFFAALGVYVLFSKLVSNRVGKLAGFLFAAGYIASDGYMSLDSSMILNVSIIFCSLSLIFYRKLYLLSLAMFFLAHYITPVRVPYFILIIIAFELIWQFKKISVKSIFVSVARLMPFSLIFYHTFIYAGDQRAGQITSFLKNIINGQFYQFYSTFGTLGYQFIPDRQLHVLAQLQGSWLIITLIVAIVIKHLNQKAKHINKITFIFIFLSMLWRIISVQIFSTPQINLTTDAKLAVFIGGFGLIVIMFMLFLTKAKRKIIIFLTVWLLASLLIYTTYEVTNIYGTTERYMGHTFVAILGLMSLAVMGKKVNKILLIIVLGWGFLNIYNSVTYQRQILLTRTIPSFEFYQNLKNYVPKLNKGDVLYFDVAPSANSLFAASFSVGQMPDETAIAWRYGIDRYDITRLTQIEELLGYLTDNGDTDNLYTFYYSSEGLVNTTDQVKKYLLGTEFQKTDITQTQNEIYFNNPLPGYLPTVFELNISAIIDEKLNFSEVPIKNKISDIKLAFEYAKYKSNIFSSAVLSASSEWRENILLNVNNGNNNSTWRPDRILFVEGKEFIQLDLGQEQLIDRLVWRNAYANNTPVNYSVEVSKDGKQWQQVAQVDQIRRIESGYLDVIEFDPLNARFVRLNLLKSLNDDAPGISEIWTVSSQFSTLDISQTEQFLSDPFAYVHDMTQFRQVLDYLGGKGRAKIYWKTDRDEGWVTNDMALINLVYDGKNYVYKFTLPTLGTKIVAIKLDDMLIPGQVLINQIKWRKPSL